MDRRIKDILIKIEENGEQAFLVGGSSRDEYLKLNYHDIDIATSASVEKLSSLFEVISDKGKIFGNVKIKYNHLIAEITTYRLEKYIYPSSYPKILRFCNNYKEDSHRRDFTINALYMDKENIIYDPFGGLSDLNKKIIRFIGNPKKRIMEDPSRILRGLRLKLKLNYEFDKKTQASMIEYIKEIKRLSINKLAFEIKKTYDECGVEKTNHIYKEYLVFKTLFGYDKELYLNNSKNIELNDIKEQLQEEMI